MGLVSLLEETGEDTAEGGHLQTRDRGSHQTLNLLHLDLGLADSRTVRN